MCSPAFGRELFRVCSCILLRNAVLTKTYSTIFTKYEASRSTDFASFFNCCWQSQISPRDYSSRASAPGRRQIMPGPMHLQRNLRILINMTITTRRTDVPRVNSFFTQHEYRNGPVGDRGSDMLHCVIFLLMPTWCELWSMTATMPVESSIEWRVSSGLPCPFYCSHLSQ